MVFGQGKYVYDVIEGWGKQFYTPFVEVTGLGVDSKDQIYIFIRGERARASMDPVLVYDSQGNLLKSWGSEHFSSKSHGLYVGPDDSVYCTDGDHTVRKFTPEGRLTLTLGKKNQPSDTGCVNRDYRTVRKSAGPFNSPTDIAVDDQGNIFVSDGYGNARVHKFSKEGELLLSWGEPGRGPGQFNLPHGIFVDREGVVYVADRENNRIQLFNSEGKFLNQWDAHRPTDIFFYKDALFVTEDAESSMISNSAKNGIPVGHLSVFSLDGELLSRWGNDDGCALGGFFAPHALCVDSKGGLYVGEVVISAGAPSKCHALQKFGRIS